MYQNRHPGPHQPGQPFKFTVTESCDRIKEEFSFLQAQYHSLKMECEKLAQEKTEMQRHYVMYYEMSYGLNVEMHKQTEIAKRLNAIIAQVIPFLSQEHQQQVAAAVERAKQVTMTELNAIIGVRTPTSLAQQMQAHHLPQAAHAPPIPMPPHPPGLGGAPGLPPSSSAGLLLANASSLAASHLNAVKDEKDRERHRRSASPNDRDKYAQERTRSRSPDMNNDVKRRKEDKGNMDSDGEKSDQDLVVDDTNEPTSPLNGERSPRENGPSKKKEGPSSPRSDGSSHSSTPSSKHKEVGEIYVCITLKYPSK